MKKSKLVRNEASKCYSRITINLLPGGCRLDTLEGREHVVVPMVILTEGVHAGSQGPLYYPKDELSKTPAIWNHKPIVVYHPTLNGEGVSACDPAVINTRKVGLMMNTKFENGKLRSEAWLERPRADAVDERIMKAVDSKEMMELSTGLFIDVEQTTGKWKSEGYDGIARNFRPDHLALLPDQIGACSIADGAGLLRNQALRDPAFRGILVKLGLVDNELSHSDIHSALMTALREKLNLSTDNPPFIWVADVFDNFFIYEKDGKFWRLGYMSNDTGVSLSDETPVQVQRKSSWVTVGATNNTKQENEMNKTALIAAILAANCGLAETDRETLNSMTDAQLNAVANMVKEHPTLNCYALDKKDGKVTLIVKNTTAPAAPAVPAVVPAANAQQPAAPKAPTVDEYINNAPPQIREMLSSGLQAHNAEKAKLVTLVLGNKKNPFTQPQLEAMAMSQLQQIAALAAPDEQPANVYALPPNYSGQAPIPAANAGQVEALSLPTMNFDPPGKKKTAAA